MSYPIRVVGRRVVGDVAEFVTPSGGWSADPAAALEVVLEGDPTVRQLAAAERAVTDFLGGYRAQAELQAAMAELHRELAAECAQMVVDSGDEPTELAVERAFAVMDSPLKSALLHARRTARRAEWVGLWSACFLRGPESWRKLDAVTAGDDALVALQAAYDDAVKEHRAGKAPSSGR